MERARELGRGGGPIQITAASKSIDFCLLKQFSIDPELKAAAK